MSIIIKGINKPKDCDYCQFCIEEDVMFETEYRCSITGIYMDEDHCFPDICPIAELPEHHGRLIDENEVRIVMNWLLTQPQRPTWNDTYNAIKDAPTIIEAE